MNPARRTTAAAAATVVLATAGTLLSTAPASAAVSCASPVFKRQFFANTSFSGTPKRTDCDTAIDQNWGTNAPASGLPKDNFTVRWTLTRDFGSGGPFTFAASTQDGIRVYLDGSRKVDLWKNVSTTAKKTVDLTVPAGRHTLRIDYVNWTGAANVKFTYTPRTSATVDKVKPLAPTGAKATYDTTTGKAKLTWAKSPEMDLAGYRVYRRLKGASFGSTPLATTTSTTYTDSTLPVTGAGYYYEVRAVDKAGNESTGTADQAVTTADRVAPAAPTITTATGEVTPSGGTGGLRVAWKTVTDAATYRVYRAASENGTYTRIATTDQLSHLDASAAESTTYYYRVSALDAAGNESARSVPQRGRIWDNDPPPVVTGLSVTPTEYGFRLAWDKSPAQDLRYYAIHKGELVGDEDEQVCYGSLVEYVSPDETSFSYTTHPDGDEVCFFVDAVDDDGNSAMKWSDDLVPAVAVTEFDMTPSVPTPEGSPLNLTVSPAEGDEGNQLSWTGLGAGEESPAPAKGFRIYRWNPATSAYEKIADLGAGAFEYFDTGGKRGTTSYYWVTGVLADGTESVPAGDWTVTAPVG
ncbi:fibronectin type III domain-containing protein [Streptomyces chartreusis]|uniref:fibronectin type III domain-containing protein n=1 Tax=Streptomyces chartreusis TaxID=1969 RepID=UPI002E81C023|nr:PA14 domain-containing protein [Streptomyces chartreusis]WUB19561.1 PA14 domain-containing protein [Streptomyces chartreusis]